MIYKDFQGQKLSALGMGGMRLPQRDGVYANIDEAQTEELLNYAMSNGINYYDTAYGYHDGNSEVVMGRILSKYPRASYCLADKFPGYDLSNMDKVEAIFEEQLKRCGVDYFDFYLFHNVCEMNIDAYLDTKYGILDYLLRQKASRRIRHLGFSAHGSQAVIKRFLDAYGAHMEFCQLQLNWIDWELQDARSKVKFLSEHNIPIWVMEPLRGGKLATLPDEYAKALKALRPNESIPAWSLRFLQTIPNVAVTLSGMSDINQIKANIRTFDEGSPLDAREMETLLEIAQNMIKNTALLCTSCRYCTKYCPRGLDIPYLLALYNERAFTNGLSSAYMALSDLPEDKRPNACIGCKSCEAVCPQNIRISQALAAFTQ